MRLSSEGLTQDRQDVASALRQLIQKQNTIVGFQ
jgi:hypothetical protein